MMLPVNHGLSTMFMTHFVFQMRFVCVMIHMINCCWSMLSELSTLLGPHLLYDLLKRPTYRHCLSSSACSALVQCNFNSKLCSVHLKSYTTLMQRMQNLKATSAWKWWSGLYYFTFILTLYYFEEDNIKSSNISNIFIYYILLLKEDMIMIWVIFLLDLCTWNYNLLKLSLIIKKNLLMLSS